jgi:hypothetical protein
MACMRLGKQLISLVSGSHWFPNYRCIFDIRLLIYMKNHRFVNEMPREAQMIQILVLYAVLDESSDLFSTLKPNVVRNYF